MIWKEWPCSGNDNVLEKGQGQIGMNSDELSQSEHGFPRTANVWLGGIPTKTLWKFGSPSREGRSKYIKISELTSNGCTSPVWEGRRSSAILGLKGVHQQRFRTAWSICRRPHYVIVRNMQQWLKTPDILVNTKITGEQLLMPSNQYNLPGEAGLNSASL